MGLLKGKKKEPKLTKKEQEAIEKGAPEMIGAQEPVEEEQPEVSAQVDIEKLKFHLKNLVQYIDKQETNHQELLIALENSVKYLTAKLTIEQVKQL